jgi:hypothetical protein
MLVTNPSTLNNMKALSPLRTVLVGFFAAFFFSLLFLSPSSASYHLELPAVNSQSQSSDDVSRLVQQGDRHIYTDFSELDSITVPERKFDSRVSIFDQKKSNWLLEHLDDQAPNFEPISLQNYVESKLYAAAKAFTNGNYAISLNILNETKLLSQSSICEAHYIRALCLQCLSRFKEGSSEYQWVLRFSEDPFLSHKASIGLKLTEKQIPTVTSDQTHFTKLIIAP